MKLFKSLLSFLIVLLFVPNANAQKTWTNGALDNTWISPTNWDGGTLPLLTDDVLLDNSNNISNGQYVHLGTINPVTVNSLTSDRSLFLMLNTGESFSTVGNQVVGDAGWGKLYQSDGTNAVGADLNLGLNASGNGTYDMWGGSLSAQNLLVGVEGTGILNQYYGNTRIDNTLSLGDAGTGYGTYWFYGDTLTLNAAVGDKSYIGNNGMGIFYQQSGTVHAENTNLIIGNTASSYGDYHMNGGNFIANSLIIGKWATSSGFDQAKGNVLINTDLVMGLKPGSYGQYGLTDLFDAATLHVQGDEWIGGLGRGYFNQQANKISSTHQVDGNLFIGSMAQWDGDAATGKAIAGWGEYMLYNSPKTASVTVNGDEVIGFGGNGIFYQSVGSHDVGGNLLIGGNTVVTDPDGGQHNLFGMGTYYMDGGVLNAHGDLVLGSSSSATFTQNAGLVTVDNRLFVGDQNGANGQYKLNGGLLSVNAGLLQGYQPETFIGNAGTGSFDQTGGIFDASLSKMYLGNLAGSQGYYFQQYKPLDPSQFSAAGLDQYLQGMLDTGLILQDSGYYYTNPAFNGLPDSYKQNLMNLVSPGLTDAEYTSIFDKTTSLLSAPLTDDLNVNGLVIGRAGQGYFNQSGGNVNVLTDMAVGRDFGSYGWYHLKSLGRLQVNGNENIADFGQADFIQDGVFSDHHVSGDLNIATKAAYHPELAVVTPDQFADFDAIRQPLIDGGYIAAVPDGNGGETYLVSGWFVSVDKKFTDQYPDQADNVNQVLISSVFNAIRAGGGTYNLNAGQLTVNGNENIGLLGYGSFYQAGGINLVGKDLNLGGSDVIGTFSDVSIGVGRSKDGTGYYEINSPDAVLNVGGNINVAPLGNGTFRQSAGSVNADHIAVGAQNNAYGFYNLDDANGFSIVTANYETIGGAGVGTFWQNGAGSTNNVAHDFRLGEMKTGNGTYTLQDGVLNVGGFMRVGDAGVGTFNQWGGDVRLSVVKGEGLTVKAQATSSTDRSSYDMQGGSLWVGSYQQDLNGGTTFHRGRIVNNDLFNIHDGGTVAAPIVIRGDIINNNEFNVSHAVVQFDGSFLNNANFHSDPSVMSFNDLTIGTNGYMRASLGDQFRISGSLLNNSAMNTLWDTHNSQLVFNSSTHTFQPNGVDKGAVLTGYTDNFAWGTVDFGNGSFNLTALNPAQLSALYADMVSGLDIRNGTVWNLGGDINVYYNPSANDWLKGQTYNFYTGSGALIPVSTVVTPEPCGLILFVIGAAVLAFWRFRFKIA